jgi:hypothetical protein
MGDYLLMKRLILLPILVISALNATSEDLSWVDEQVNAIKPPRDGESMSNISKIRDPFIFLEKNGSKDKKDKASVASKTLTANSNTSSSSNSLDEAKDKPPVFTKNSFVLGAIINDSALINGKWHKKGDTVNSYKITEIGKKIVTLRSGSNTKILTTVSENSKLIFKR